MAIELTNNQQEKLDGEHGETNNDGLLQTAPADSALAAGIDRRSLMQNAVIGAAAVMTGAALTPEASAQAPKETKFVLTGIARAKGKAVGEFDCHDARLIGWAGSAI